MAQVLVQPSNRRAYPMAAYANVGAKIQEDISEASCIFGVKQVRAGMFVLYILFKHPVPGPRSPLMLSCPTRPSASSPTPSRPSLTTWICSMPCSRRMSGHIIYITSSVWNTIPTWNKLSVANVTTNLQFTTAGVLTMRQWWMPKDKEL